MHTHTHTAYVDKMNQLQARVFRVKLTFCILYHDQQANTQTHMCLWHIIRIMLTPLRCQLTAFRVNIK